MEKEIKLKMELLELEILKTDNLLLQVLFADLRKSIFQEKNPEKKVEKKVEKKTKKKVEKTKNIIPPEATYIVADDGKGKQRKAIFLDIEYNEIEHTDKRFDSLIWSLKKQGVELQKTGIGEYTIISV